MPGLKGFKNAPPLPRIRGAGARPLGIYAGARPLGALVPGPKGFQSDSPLGPKELNIAFTLMN